MTQSNPNSESNKISFEESLNVSVISSVHDRLCEHVVSDGGVCVDLSEVTDIDTSAIQLLIASKRFAEESSLEFEIQETPEAVMKCIAACGASDHLGFETK